MDTSISRPLSLLEQCISTLLANIPVWIVIPSPDDFDEISHPGDNSLHLRHGIFLPENICNFIIADIDMMRNYNGYTLVEVFADYMRTKISDIDLRKRKIRLRDFKTIMMHRPEKLICDQMTIIDAEGDNEFSMNESTNAMMQILIKNMKKCHYLSLGSYLSDFLDNCFDMEYRSCDKLRFLSGRILDNRDEIFDNFKFFNNLCTLELHESQIEAYQLKIIVNACSNSLTALSLRGSKRVTADVVGMFDAICRCWKLLSLDISMPQKLPLAGAYFSDPENFLLTIFQSLSQLRNLDISFTNLDKAMTTADGWKRVRPHYLPPLDCLGLVFCVHDAASYTHHPATNILGDTSPRLIANTLRCWKCFGPSLEVFLPTAQRYFRDHLHSLKNSLHDLFDCLHYLCAILDLHRDLKEVMFSATGCSFYIIKAVRPELPPQLVWQVLTSMASCLNDDRLYLETWRNSAITIVQLISDGFTHGHRLAADATLRRIKAFINHHRSVTIESTSVFAWTLNAMTCISHDFKRVLGDLGAVKVGTDLVACLLNHLTNEPNSAEYEHTLETAWTILWNLTDETHKNSSRFIDEENGIELFIKTLDFCKDNATVTRNVLGAMGNVAEVPWLRDRLRHRRVLRKLIELLDYNDLEVEYNTSGIMCHIFSDGRSIWKFDYADISYDDLQILICNRVFEWDLHAERGINYSSFAPIISLLNHSDCLSCIAWTCWALCNMMTVYPDRYIPMLVRELDTEAMMLIVQDTTLDHRIRNYAELVWQRVKAKKEEQKASQISETIDSQESSAVEASAEDEDDMDEDDGDVDADLSA